MARDNSGAYRLDVRHFMRALDIHNVTIAAVTGSREVGGRTPCWTSLQRSVRHDAIHLGAMRFKRPVEAVFAVRDEITAAVVSAILPAVANSQLRRAMRKPPDSLGV